MKSDEQKELERRLFQFGRIVLGKDSGGMIAKLKNLRGDIGAWNILMAAHGTADPREYIAKALHNMKVERQPVSEEEFTRLQARYQQKRMNEGWR